MSGETGPGAPVAMPAIMLPPSIAEGELARLALLRCEADLAFAERRVAVREATLEVLRCDPADARAARDEGGLVATVWRWIGPSDGDPTVDRVRRSGLFLPGWYARRHRDRIGAAEPLAHFLGEGLAAGLMPNPFLDPAWYAAAHALDPAGEPAVLHYLRIGAAYALSPGPLFDAADYVARYLQAVNEPDPLAHFLREGIDAGLLPEPVAA